MTAPGRGSWLHASAGHKKIARAVGAELTPVSPGAVYRLLGMPPQSSRDALLRAARDDQHKLAATLLSLWAADGENLTDAEADELHAHRYRIDFYHQFWRELQKVAPHVFLVKGMTVADLYPPHVLRSAGDLDVICPRHEDFWSCSRYIAESGWEIKAFTAQQSRRGEAVPYHLLAEFHKGSDSSEPYMIGLSTAEIVTRINRPFQQLTRHARSPLATSVVALIAERWERPFRSRDLLDLILLLQSVDEAGIDQIRADLAITGLWPEWREAMREISRLGWEPAVILPHVRVASGREHLLRAVHVLLRWTNLVQALASAAQAGIEDQTGRFADIASDLICRRVGTKRLFAAGIPLFGVPLDAEQASTMSLKDVGGHLVIRTPMGSFLMVAGSAKQEWLDEAGKEASNLVVRGM